MRRTADLISGEIYTDGLSNVLSEPEFAESDEARRALKLFGVMDLVDLVNMVTQHGANAAILIGFDQHLPADQKPLLPVR